MAKLTTITELRKYYPEAKGRAVSKQMTHLEKHSRRFIELSPFLTLGTVGEDRLGDVSPKGDTPGFVHIQDDTTLLIPDRPGNNRLDSLTNLLSNPAIGLIFFIPGVQEVLRINGRGEVRDDPEMLNLFDPKDKPPRTVIVVHIQEVYLHCAKSILRSNLWDAETKVDRSVLPTMNQMVADQIGHSGPVESQEDMLTRYAKRLY